MKKENINKVMVPIADIIPNEENPRNMSEDNMESLKESLTEFGFLIPVILNGRKGRENRLIGGHQRLKVAETIGMTEVPAVYVDLTEKKERELSLRFGKNTGHWDWEALSAIDAEILLDAGFSEVELARNGAGGMGMEVETASGDRPMTLTLSFRTEGELETMAAHFTGKDMVTKTRSLLKAMKEGKV